ncbi:MAG TPA: DUF6049 family protein [Actinomycetota bacterium]|nr:DUF6049 family protein [Actinomycetota bacterium]
MRRLFATLVVLSTLVLAAPPAFAAPRPDVSIRLLGMAPWLTPQKPDLGLHAVATNTGPGAADDLSFGLTVFTPSRSRNQYEESLRHDPSDAGDLYARFGKITGTLAPGATMDLELSRKIIRDVAATVVGGNETAVYPMNIELRSGDRTLASIRTPIVFLNFAKRQVVATTRLRLGWSFALHQGIDYGADGTYLDGSLQDAVAPGGRLAEEVAALDAAANDPKHPRPIDVVWSPTLIAQLQDMRDGYAVRNGATVEQVPEGQGGAADANAVLEKMHQLAAAPLVESSALPYAVPNIPALLSAGLGVDLPVQLQRGEDAVGAFTGNPVTSDIFWPPGGNIDQASLSTLAAHGIRTFLMTPAMVHRAPQPKEFAQPATTALQSSVTGTVTGIVPDAGVETILSSGVSERDPRLAAQNVLGELAQIWLEQPGIPRAVALSVPDSLDVPGSLFRPLIKVVGRAPFLQIQKASALVKNFHPDPSQPAQLFPNYGQFFAQGYADEIAAARADISTFRSILVNPSPVPDRLEDTVLLSEGGSFTEDPAAGMALLGGIRSRLDGLFRGIRPDTTRSVTLASGAGVVPIGITNDTPDLVRVKIRLISARLEPEAKTETVTLRGGSTKLLPFRVRSRTTGRFPVQISVLTPDGKPLYPPGVLVVRSTSYNLVALLLVLGAALFLLVWWARRFLPGRRPPRAPSTVLPPQAKPA